jgi:hypothetical protein
MGKTVLGMQPYTLFQFSYAKLELKIEKTYIKAALAKGKPKVIVLCLVNEAEQIKNWNLDLFNCEFNAH